MRMMTLGESCDMVLSLLALGLHPLLRAGPSCGVPQPFASLPSTKLGELWATATRSLRIHSSPSLDRLVLAKWGACGRGSPCAPAASPTLLLPILPCLHRCMSGWQPGLRGRRAAALRLLGCCQRAGACARCRDRDLAWARCREFGGPEQRAGAACNDQKQWRIQMLVEQPPLCSRHPGHPPRAPH